MKNCLPAEIALKSLFLGPQAENAVWVEEQVTELLRHWFEWRKSTFPEDGSAISNLDRQEPRFVELRSAVQARLDELMKRLESEIPTHSPRYIGHMFSEVALPALFGHLAALLHNPNLVSDESAQVAVQIENDVIRDLVQLMNWKTGEGHFTSGGTIANFEALVRGRARAHAWMANSSASSLLQAAHQGWQHWNPQGPSVPGSLFDWADQLKERYGHPFKGGVVLVPNSKHYSWVKGVDAFGMGTESFWGIDLDSEGRLDPTHLKIQIERAKKENRPIYLVVSVAGTTELGQFDPVHQVQDLLDQYQQKEGLHLWHHVDAAYGGFFKTALNNADWDSVTRQALQGLERVDSITLDPHKLGYVPYACGVFLCKNQKDYRMLRAQAPYLQFQESKDRGRFTLEGSRPGTGAAATWMAAKTIGLEEEGYGRILNRTLKARKMLEEALLSSNLPLHLVPASSSNILAFHVATQGASLKESNAATLALAQKYGPGTQAAFTVSQTRISIQAYKKFAERFLSQWNSTIDTTEVALVRVCIMNPFFGSKEMKVNLAQEWVRELSKTLIAKS